MPLRALRSLCRGPVPMFYFLARSLVSSFRSAFRFFCRVVFLRIITARFARQRRRPLPRPRGPERTLVRGFVVRSLRQEAPVPPLCGTGAQELGQKVFGELFGLGREGAAGELPRPPAAGEVARRLRLGEAAADDERVGRDPLAGVPGRGFRLICPSAVALTDGGEDRGGILRGRAVPRAGPDRAQRP